MRVKGGQYSLVKSYIFSLTAAVTLLAGCISPAPTATTTPVPDAPVDSATQAIPVGPILTSTPAMPPTPTTSPYPWTDESAVMSGLCFESVDDAAGQTFILTSLEDLIHFYDLADHSELCRQPVTRNSFDFSNGRILAGLWSKATGCRAHHEVEQVHRDDTARTLFIFLRLVVEGDCTYELVRPFWIGLSGLSDYDIQFVVQ
jgi:hypothetical protein